jgi:hypothetical protein
MRLFLSLYKIEEEKATPFPEIQRKKAFRFSSRSTKIPRTREIFSLFSKKLLTKPKSCGIIKPVMAE